MLKKKAQFAKKKKQLKSLLYTSIIRPQLEYASDVWGGCPSPDCDKLVKMQLIAARIVTVLPIFASSRNRMGHIKYKEENI